MIRAKLSCPGNYCVRFSVLFSFLSCIGRVPFVFCPLSILTFPLISLCVCWSFLVLMCLLCLLLSPPLCVYILQLFSFVLYTFVLFIRQQIQPWSCYQSSSLRFFIYLSKVLSLCFSSQGGFNVLLHSMCFPSVSVVLICYFLVLCDLLSESFFLSFS